MDTGTFDCTFDSSSNTRSSSVKNRGAGKARVSWITCTTFVCAILLFVGACGGGGARTTTDEQGNAVQLAATFSKSFGLDSVDFASDFIEMPDGGYAAAGNVNGALWVAKLNADGDREWEHLIDDVGLPDPSLTFPDLQAIDSASTGDYCVAGSVVRVDNGVTWLDAYIARYNAADALLWEVAVDSAGWPGYTIVPASGQAGATDVFTSVVAHDDGGCVAAGPSRATIRQQLEDGVSVTLDGHRTLVARAAAGAVEWRRAEEPHTGFSRGTGRVFGQGGGETVYANRLPDGDDELRVVVLTASGRARLTRVVSDVAQAASAAALTDDEDLGGGRDGRRDDGVIVVAGTEVVRLDRRGVLLWRTALPTGQVEREEQHAHWVSQVCEGSVCGFWVYSNQRPRGFRYPRPTNAYDGRLHRLSVFGEVTRERSLGFSVGQTIPQPLVLAVREASDGAFNVLYAEGPEQRGRRWTGRWTLGLDATFSEPQNTFSVERGAATVTRQETPQQVDAGIWRSDNSVIGLRREARLEVLGDSLRVVSRNHAYMVDSAGWRSGREFEGAGLQPTVATDGVLVGRAGAWRMDEGDRLAALPAFTDGWVEGIAVNDAVESDFVIASEGRLLFVRNLVAQAVWPYGGELLYLKTLNSGATIAVSADRLGFQVVRVDSDFALDAARRYTVRGVLPDAITATVDDDGAVAIAITSNADVVFRDEPESPEPAPLPGERDDTNVIVVKLSADGNTEWAHAFGGAAYDWANQVRFASDGGLLVAGESESLGPRGDAWLLRLGPDGRVSEGCNAFLAYIDPADVVQFTEESVEGDAGAFSITMSPELATTTLPEPMRFDEPETVQARQCLGTVRETPLEAPASDRASLTVVQAGSEAGLVTSTPAGIFCDSINAQTCAASFNAETLVTLRVDDAAAPRFRGWDAQCPEVRLNPHRCVVPLRGDTSLEVYFEPEDGTTSTLDLVVSGNGRVISTRDLNINCGVGGVADGCQAIYPRGTRVRLETDRPADEQFQGWFGDCVEFASAQSILLDLSADVNCEAQFSGTAPPIPDLVDLTVGKALNEVPDTAVNISGQVDVTPGDIRCSSPTFDVCTDQFERGTLVTLNARPIPSAFFDRWVSTDADGGCDGMVTPRITLLMDRDRDCRAHFRTFTGQTVQVAVSRQIDLQNANNVIFGGTIASIPAGIDCGRPGLSDTCQASFAVNSTIQLGVTFVQQGLRFVRWEGCANSTDAALNLRMDRGFIECVAVFETAPPTGPTSTVSVLFDGFIGRITDENTGLLDCNTNCMVALPRSVSPVRLLAVGAQPGFINCDQIEDTSAGRVCILDITAGDRSIVVEP